MYTDSLAKAIQTADTDKVRDFLQRGGDPNTKSKRKNTLLHESAHHLVPDIVALLLQAGADPDAEEPAFQKRPLHTAIGPKQFPQVIYARPPEPADVIARRHRVVDLLLQAGADPGRRKQPGEMNAYFRSPLQFAARQGDPAIVQKLLDAGACPDEKDALGGGPAVEAVNQVHGAALGALIDAGVDLSPKTHRKNLPLNRISGALSKMMYDIEQNYGEAMKPKTAAFASLKNEMVDITKRLIAAGAELDAKDHTGDAPLHACVNEPFPFLVAILLEAGADPSVQNRFGQSALVMAVSVINSRKLSVDAMVPVIRQLLPFSGRDATHEEGKTALTLAQEFGYDDIVALLE